MKEEATSLHFPKPFPQRVHTRLRRSHTEPGTLPSYDSLPSFLSSLPPYSIHHLSLQKASNPSLLTVIRWRLFLVSCKCHSPRLVSSLPSSCSYSTERMWASCLWIYGPPGNGGELWSYEMPRRHSL
uniref:Uncharacterized protein n=1 Tax=Rousettus aegyptiacus TaxID=9407 RepID=A0A7J8CHT2_ROUAE|nr:hypothetical protein HJG63_008984 [Rousettus aegyptiacus]